MAEPTGFDYTTRADGSVAITRGGKHAITLRGSRAAKFLTQIETGDQQRTMARWTGSYKFGNERTARDHPRNRRR